LGDLVHAAWILAPTPVVDEAFRARGLEPPLPSVTTFSFYLREMLLTTRDCLSVVPASMLHAFNSRGVAVKPLAIDLGVDAHPMAILTLKNRTLSPAVQLFIEAVRGVGKSMSGASK